MATKVDYLKRGKKPLLFYLFGLLVLGYFFLIWTNFSSFLARFSRQFGYLDGQHHWRVLDDFVNFKMPYKDYFLNPSHGWLYMLFQSPFYLLFQRTFLGILVIEFLLLPVLGLVLSYLVARIVLRKKHLIFIFLFFCCLFWVNYHYTSPRHLIAELGLSFFILYILENRTKYLLASGIIAGLATLISFEYALAFNLAILFVFFVSLFSDKRFARPFFSRFLLGEMAILFPFFSWLHLKGVLKSFWDYTYGFINNFYFASPCADGFPRLSEIETMRSTSKLLIFNLPVEFLQRLNFYLIFGFYAVSALVLFVYFVKDKKLSKNNLVKLSLVVYGLLIFLRTVDTPCVGYFIYGLVPFFLLLTFLIEKMVLWSQPQKTLSKKLLGFLAIGLIFFWFVLTENTGFIIKAFGKKEAPVKKVTYEKEIYPPAGWYLRKDFAEGYREISDYIVENTHEDDFLYVYPWGPYNNLTDRPAPNSLPTAAHFLVGEEFVIRTRTELITKKPKLVAINLYNGGVLYGKERKDVSRYFSLGEEDGPVFAGGGNIVEKYILENYKSVFKNEMAVVMKQRAKPIKIEERKKESYLWLPEKADKIELQSMVRKDNNLNYKILGKNASWALVFEEPVRVADIFVELKLDGDFLTKHLSRYFLNFYAVAADSQENEPDMIKTRSLARKTWQTTKIEFIQPREIKTLIIEISNNGGLVWWLKPYNLAIRKISFYDFYQEPK